MFPSETKDQKSFIVVSTSGRTPLLANTWTPLSNLGTTRSSRLPRHTTRQQYLPYRNYLLKRAPGKHCLFQPGSLTIKERGRRQQSIFLAIVPLVGSLSAPLSINPSLAYSVKGSACQQHSVNKKTESKLHMLFAAQ